MFEDRGSTLFYSKKKHGAGQYLGKVEVQRFNSDKYQVSTPVSPGDVVFVNTYDQQNRYCGYWAKITKVKYKPVYYTLGIYFMNDMKKVCLILKNRPYWQRGLFNFPGGKVEPGELIDNCIIREFKEETGVDCRSWIYQGEMYDSEKSWIVHVYASCHDEEQQFPETKEDQYILNVDVDNLPPNIIPNVKWMIDFAKDHLRNPNLISFKIKYQ